MSAEVLNGDAAAIAGKESKSSGGGGNGILEVESAKCDCCGLTEECTPAYIARIREGHAGRWICGLCSEAVKDEICRAERLISTEEALNRHMKFSKSFLSSSPPSDSTEHLISAMRQLLRRSLDSPRAMRSTPSTPRRKSGGGGDGIGSRHSLARSESCFSTLAG